MGYLGNQITKVFPTSISVDSASVSNDLTVDTSTFKVDSANNRVGIGTASPDVALEISKNSGGSTLKLTRSNTASTDDNFGSIEFENSAGTVLSGIKGTSMSGNTEAGLIFGAGGGNTERMRIDNSGAVTMPNQPCFLVGKSSSATQNNIAVDTNVTVTFDTETVDTNSAFASNVFTVPSGEGGMYFISLRGAMQGIDAGEFIQLRIYLNGSAVDFFENRMTAYTTDVEFKFSGSGSLNLSAADTISYYVYQNSGDSQNLSNAGLYMFKLLGV